MYTLQDKPSFRGFKSYDKIDCVPFKKESNIK